MSLLTALLGFIGGLLTPWIRWEIDKRKVSRKEKTEHITNWRNQIDSFDFEIDVLGDATWYSALRSHMRLDIIKEVEAQRTLHVGGGRGEMVIKHMLLDEVARLERGLWRE